MKINRIIAATFTNKDTNTLIPIQGNAWEVLELISYKMSDITNNKIEILWEDDGTQNLRVNDELIGWYSDSLTKEDLEILEKDCNEILKKTNYSINLYLLL
jgi:hypothetical protein